MTSLAADFFGSKAYYDVIVWHSVEAGFLGSKAYYDVIVWNYVWNYV
jgi:hypothetical protein